MLKKYSLWIVAVVALVIAVVSFIPSTRTAIVVGAIGVNPVENYIPIIKYNEGYYSELPITTTGTSTSATTTSSGFQVGTGTIVSKFLTGTCNAISYAALSATSTLLHDCAVTGVSSGDKVFVTLPNTKTSTFGGFSVSNAGASSTANYISFHILNLTGAATSSYVGATTSVQYLVTR
jgi:hypothetical protein